MLVISRHKDDAIVLSGGVRILVVDVRGGKARIGIDAPKDCQIWREEIAKDAFPELVEQVRLAREGKG